MKKQPRLAAALLVTTSLLAVAPAVTLIASPAHATQRADTLPPGHERDFPGCLTCWES